MTLIEWQDRFRTEEACQDYLYHQRWPHGFVCSQCGGTKCWKVHRFGRTVPLYECSA
ncbi:MAG: transposase [Sulfobacillus sp.]